MNTNPNESHTFLLQAIENEDEPKIKELLKDGVDPNELVSVRGLKVPIWFAALPISSYGQNRKAILKPKALKVLLENGANINSKNQHEESALHFLVSDCQIPARFSDAAKALLEYGLDVNIGKEKGNTALKNAVISSAFKRPNLKIIEFLLNAKADPNVVDPDSGKTILLHVCINSNENQDMILEIASLLIKAGADVNAQETWKGRSSLMWAVKNRNLELAKLLAKAGADLKAENQKENTNAYILALENDHTEIVEWLESLGFKDTGLRPNRALQFKNIQKEKWKESIEAGLQAINVFPNDWRIPSNLAFAYRRLGNFEESDRWAKISLDLKFNLDSFNILLTNCISTSKPKEAILIWKNYRDQIQKIEADKGNIYTNVLVAYFLIQQYSEAIAELGNPWEIQTDLGSFFLNLACVYVKLEDTTSAIRAVMEALNRGYTVEKLAKDNDLKPLIDLTVFQFLLKNGSNEFVSETFFKEQDCIELIRNRSEIIERDMFATKNITQSNFKLETPHQIAFKFAELKDLHTQSGWKSDPKKLSPIEENLAKEIDSILNEFSVSKNSDSKVGAILMEWDYDDDGFSYYLCIETYKNVEKAKIKYRTYHGTDKDTIYENDLEHRDRIYSQESFERIVDRLTQEESFQKIKKLPLLFFVHAEHDSGNEFIVEHEI
ncbi:ankyrin repeat protein [Leptospira kirschneri str. 200803703]|uniref:Ankyrin repeat protein n=1 Tax=Leptospira kirschneri str. 200802841 TaxID=1193047 RepID=A0A828Y8J7_9LEPT|nr:ankyrin repeat domain-containing protein [Leptospira kirschneri]EKO51949.1 ankyrin repeat protein [Leptospira kirschneri str. 200802841]EMK13920.1 ankyrin repeat protein [Leptospira kirschneri serovar Bim str. PUO 1247]EMN06249.1 ankyrin repeat protein [Leptospira kirschneri serovar Bim str. 1051]EMO65397.1 ankyrin repeat protein [Leptospira kirschneri str. 200803703]